MQRSVSALIRLLSILSVLASVALLAPSRVWSADNPGDAGDKAIPDAVRKECLKRGKIYADCATNARRLLQGWLDKNYDAKTHLTYWIRNKNRPRWDYHDVAADSYSSLVLMARYVAPECNEPGGPLHETLLASQKLCTLPNGLPGLYYFDTGKVESEATYLALSEWLRDGLIRIVENLGTDNAWYDEMCRLTDAMIVVAHQRGGLMKQCHGNTEALGNMAQSLARMYIMSGNRRYLKAAERIGDALLLDPDSEVLKTAQRRFVDHGCETIPGLTELFAVECQLKTKRATAYRKPLTKLLDHVLQASARPETGLLCEPKQIDGKTVWQAPPHTWGYVFFAYENYDRATGSDRYLKALEKPIHWLLDNYPNYEQCKQAELWPKVTNRNCWDDSHESMVILTNRLGIFDQQVFDWLDWAILRDNQRRNDNNKYGPYRNAHNDGGAGRCLCTHMMVCSRGVRNLPFQDGVCVGAMPSGDRLVLTIESDKPYQGKLCFDRPRCAYPTGTLDWARVNEMPTWFVAQPDHKYTVTVDGSQPKTVSGKDLIDGLPITLKPDKTQTLCVQPAAKQPKS